MKKGKAELPRRLPTAHELEFAAREGHLMEVPLPFERCPTVGDMPMPDVDDVDPQEWLGSLRLNGRGIDVWTSEEREQFAAFFAGLGAALKIYGRRH